MQLQLSRSTERDACSIRDEDHHWSCGMVGERRDSGGAVGNAPPTTPRAMRQRPGGVVHGLPPRPEGGVPVPGGGSSTIPQDCPCDAPTGDGTGHHSLASTHKFCGRPVFRNIPTGEFRECYSVIRLKSRSGIAQMANMARRQTGRT